MLCLPGIIWYNGCRQDAATPRSFALAHSSIVFSWSVAVNELTESALAQWEKQSVCWGLQCLSSFPIALRSQQSECFAGLPQSYVCISAVK